MSSEMGLLGLPTPLRQLVSSRFEAARKSGDLIFSNTQLAILRSKANAAFQLRYCPALAQKPKDNTPQSDQQNPKPKPDPFENPQGALLIGPVPKPTQSHRLVLNKYPVIPNHFIVATKANLPQTDILAKADLDVVHQCIRSWSDNAQNGRAELFAFFNSGEHSGASQVHRHLQFLPVEAMAEQHHGKWTPLLSNMTKAAHSTLPLLRDPRLPFLHFATRIGSPAAPDDLHMRYIMLLKAALSATRNPTSDLEYDEEVVISENGQTTFSYNLAMTIDMMAICPRKSESASVPLGKEEASVSINGTILAGTLMVKGQEEWKALQEHPSMLDQMLTEIGFGTAEHSKASDGNKL